MKISPKIKYMLEGGTMPLEDPTIAQPMLEEGVPLGGDPIQLLAEMAMLALLSLDCSLMAQVCQVFVQMLQQAQGGGAPAPEEPVFRKGGKLDYRIKR